MKILDLQYAMILIASQNTIKHVAYLCTYTF